MTSLSCSVGVEDVAKAGALIPGDISFAVCQDEGLPGNVASPGPSCTPGHMGMAQVIGFRVTSDPCPPPPFPCLPCPLGFTSQLALCTWLVP